MSQSPDLEQFRTSAKAPERLRPAAGPARLHRVLIGAIACLLTAMSVLGVLLFTQAGPEAAPAPKAGAPKTAAQPEDVAAVWRALGGLTRAHLYQSNLSLGLLADGVEEDLYTLPQARRLLGNVTQVLEEVEHDLERLPDAGLADTDRHLLEQVREALALIRDQARELRAYWNSGEKEAADRFHQKRAAAAGRLEQLVRFDP